MLILTVSKRLGCLAVVIAGIASLNSAGLVSPVVVVQQAPPTIGLFKVSESITKGDHASGCRDPYHQPSEGGRAVQLNAMPCVADSRDLLAVQRPGLTLQPLAEPTPIVRDKRNQPIMF